MRFVRTWLLGGGIGRTAPGPARPLPSEDRPMSNATPMQSALLLKNKAVEVARLNDTLAKGWMVKHAVPLGDAVLIITEKQFFGEEYRSAQDVVTKRTEAAEETAVKEQRGGSYGSGSRV
jgi:hypothetical protein